MLGIFDIAGSAMAAQTVRLTATASNLSNAENAAGSKESVYKARYPVFESIYDDFAEQSVGVKVARVVESEAEAIKEYAPGHPKADDDGYIYKPNVNVISQMADMINASRSYQMNVQVLDSAKNMMLRTLQLGQ